MLPRNWSKLSAERHYFCCLLAIQILAAINKLAEAQEGSDSAGKPNVKQERDFRWPNKQLNVLLDLKTLNETEQLILNALFDQLEHKSCVRINRLPETMNPFDPRSHQEVGNFLYVFKSHQFGLYNKHPSLGLSSFGCVQQGRQSLVLTDLAFRWPELVLRYHILRSLGVESLERPDGQVRRLLNMLPLSMKISNDDLPLHSLAGPFPTSPFAGPIPSGGSSPSVTSSEPPGGQVAYAAVVSLGASRALKTSGGSPSLEMRRVNQDSGKLALTPVQYLSEQDLDKVKRLYQCSEYQNKLSLKPLGEQLEPPGDLQPQQQQQEATLYSYPDRIDANGKQPDGNWLGAPSSAQVITEPKEPLKINDSAIDEAAKSIVDYLLSESKNGSSELAQQEQANQDTPDRMDSLFPESDKPSSCKPLESCPLDSTADKKERPMLLKLDSFHALDPELRQANQMYLSQPASQPSGYSEQSASPSTYRLMEGPEWREQQQQQFQAPKTEMMISFEQADQSMASNPVAALAGSKVLKLCSCTCQTMRPSSQDPARPVTESHQDLTSEQEQGSTPVQFNESSTLPVTSDTPAPPTSPVNLTEPWLPNATEPIAPEPSSTSPAPTSVSDEPTFPTTVEDFTGSPSTERGLNQSSTIGEGAFTGGPNGNLAQSAACDQVEWVRPNKTVYASAKIVWDLDRANQNYFLCNNMVNDQLVPGKTHGFSCKISSEGKAYELHNFNVLTKPERVNLAWIQRNSDSFGITNLPVVGGFSKNQDPYIVSRCLVRDENNDVITLIGYVNNQGVGLFPFDDIQIECSQYDVLACVN